LGGKKNLGNENLKGIIPLADYDRSEVGRHGIFKLFG
jgi:hypothetical protein